MWYFSLSFSVWDSKNWDPSDIVAYIIALCTIAIMWTFPFDWIVILGSFIKVLILSLTTQFTPFYKPFTGGKKSKITPTR